MRRLWRAAIFSWRGVVIAWRDEAAFRLEIILATVLVAVACVLPVSGGARALLIFSVLLIPVVELLNTAVEAVVDLATDEQKPLAAKAKDCGSAAVLAVIIAAAAAWGTVLWSN